MKTLREMMDLIESAQPVDLRAQAAELAVQILKNADMDDDSEQGYIRVDPDALFKFHILMNTAKKQGVAEEQLEETEVDPVRRVEELFRNK